MSDIEHAMITAAEDLLSALPPAAQREARFPFSGPARTEWSYLPGTRRGIELADLSPAGRKAAHRLLATALSRSAFAQAVTIMAFEELLDLDERGERNRHSDGYHAAVFGTPGDDGWGWRFEGHHLSVNVTVVAGQPIVAPLFLGANPARVRHDGDLVVAPLLREEEFARDFVTSLPPALRKQAVISDTAPADIVTAMAVTADTRIDPPGIAASELPDEARGQLRRLIGAYLGRLAPDLADAGLRGIGETEASFAWSGGLRPSDGHYYRIQAPGLLIEYDNTQRQANHAHTVLRRPGSDFGASSLLAAHLAAERPASRLPQARTHRCDLVQRDRRGYPGVQRFRPGRHGDPHQQVASGGDHTREAAPFGSDDQHQRTVRDRHLVHVRRPGGVQPRDEEPVALVRLQRPRQVDRPRHRHPGQRARRRLPRARGHPGAAPRRHDHAHRPERGGGTYHSAQIAGVRDTVQSHDERRRRDAPFGKVFWVCVVVGADPQGDALMHH
jgi:hypothetical protein